MGTSKDAIANLVLAHLEVSREISNLETEKSTEASLIRRHYPGSLEEVLGDYPWPEATRYRVLSLVANDPTDDWRYAYRYPNDCVHARRLVTGKGRDETDPPPWKTGSDEQGLLIYANITPATLEYTVLLTDPRLFSSTFVQALSWKIASLCTSLSKVSDIKKVCLQMYELSVGRAETKAANEQQQPKELDSEMIRSRG